MNQNTPYLRRLWAAILGRPKTVAAPGTPTANRGNLEAELRDRDERIAAMEGEYAQLQEDKARAVAESGGEQLERLFKKLCSPLATLSTLAHAARAGQPVEVRDLADLVVSLEKALTAAGLERVGEPGVEAAFDIALHQRMSGGAPHGGAPVKVRLPGYRLGAKVLQKAMVSGRED